MGQASDYRSMGLILSADKDKFLYKADKVWLNTTEFWNVMGLRPEGATLAKKRVDEPHGPGNSFWKAKGAKGKTTLKRELFRKHLQTLVFGKPHA